MLIELNKSFEYKFIYKIKNAFEIISRELSIIIWVSMVFALIIWSYAQNQREISKRSEIKMYEQLSITEEFEISENI